MRIMLLYVIFLFFGCQNQHSTTEKKDSFKKSASSDTVRMNFDTATMSQKERINKLIELSAIKEFKYSRQELVDQGAKYNYTITEIKQFGNSFNYNVSIPNVNIEMDYTCIPERGEFIIYMIGEKELISAQYNLIKVQHQWDDCRKIEEGENCEVETKDIQYPIQTHVLVSLSNSGKESILNFRRSSKPVK